MGKGRAPCCDKTKVKRGPWSPEEDLRLISFIQQNGHPNWRALPNQAGLRRCGKSCRLRWINYLRPDVKRGNITHEEEETIIKLHETYGNKWSIIASCMPGRTDNEIKNVWNTHLKRKFIKPDTSANITSSSSSYLIKKCKKTSSTVDPPTSPATSTLSSDVDDDQNNDKPTTSIKPINSNIEPTSNFQDVNHQYPPLQLVDPILSPTLSCVSNDPYQSALFQPPTDLSIELAPENNIIDPSMDYIWDVLELDGLWPHDGLNETHNSETHLTNDCDQDELIKGSNGRGSVANYSGAGEQKSNNSGNSGSKLQDWVRYLEMELGLYDHEDNPAN